MYPKLFIEYLAYFHGTRDYFECHEVLEEYWKKVDPKNRNSVWVLLIQLAVSMYHYRRGNVKGASILIRRCQDKMKMNGEAIKKLGINPDQLSNRITETANRLDQNYPYQSFNLPIDDPYLLQEVRKLCHQWNTSYGNESDLSNEFIINKHRLRNRE